MAPFYERHCKVDNDRFDKMAEKGRVEAYRALSNDKIRKIIGVFLLKQVVFLRKSYGNALQVLNIPRHEEEILWSRRLIP